MSYLKSLRFCKVIMYPKYSTMVRASDSTSGSNDKINFFWLYLVYLCFKYSSLSNHILIFLHCNSLGVSFLQNHNALVIFSVVQYIFTMRRANAIMYEKCIMFPRYDMTSDVCTQSTILLVLKQTRKRVIKLNTLKNTEKKDSMY